MESISIQAREWLIRGGGGEGLISGSLRYHKLLYLNQKKPCESRPRFLFFVVLVMKFNFSLKLGFLS